MEKTWVCHGAALLGLKQYDQARRLFQAELDAAAASCNRELMAHQLLNTGGTFALMGDMLTARHHLDRANELYCSLGWSAQRVKVLEALGYLDVRERGNDGRQTLEQASAEFERLGMDGDWVDARVDLAEGLVSVDRTADVSEICREAYERAIALGISGLAERALALLERGSVRTSGADNPM